MKKLYLKTVGAILAGFASAAAASIITDILLEKSGFMKTEPFSDNSTGVILIILIYRTIYNVLGCFLAAKLAPYRPMFHAMTIGIIGVIIGTIGTIVMWDTPPHWYPIALVLLSLPSAWLGGKLEENRIKKRIQINS